MIGALIEGLVGIDALRIGTPVQQAAWRALTTLGILDVLAPYQPRLVGTIPINVDIPGSDLDIICQAHDLDALADELKDRFGELPGFRCARKIRYQRPVLVCEFHFAGFPFQVYASGRPVDVQRAWVHMVAEAYLLAEGGDAARAQVRALKRAGLKTEPAFARVFGLTDDPYQALYALGMRLLAEGKF